MARDIRTAALAEPIEVVTYLFTRLKQMGVDSVHGVPGDFNLVALDYLDPCGLKWVGNCNELNAGYAADGYARIKGMSAIVTTFGVGELSLLNAIAGSYAEYVPVVHIVGTPSTVSQQAGMLLHHSLGNGNFNVFADMSAQISIDVAKLNDVRDAATQIDHALRECYVRSRPVYISMPTDIALKKVEGARLNTPIDVSPPLNDSEKEAYVLDVIVKRLAGAQNPAILVDSCTIRHRAISETRELIGKSGLPTFVTPMGKGAVDETLSNYGGLYAGDASNPGVREIVESADLLLYVGALKSDINTAGFSVRTNELNTVEFHSTFTRVGYSEYQGIGMKGLLRKIVDNLPKLNVQPIPERPTNGTSSDDSTETTITHRWFWPRVGHWLQQDDIVLSETGTSNYGIFDTRFPQGVTNINQALWSSIGYSVGACQGAALAANETGNRRTILFVGDGSFQLTGQELSTMIRHNLNPIIFVICNEGYTIERFVHGMEAAYNDIQLWDHRQLVSAFGGKQGQYNTYRVETREQVLSLFQDKSFASAEHLQLVELVMPKTDGPDALKLVCESAAKLNAK